jgi:hypothetical protein
MGKDHDSSVLRFKVIFEQLTPRLYSAPQPTRRDPGGSREDPPDYADQKEKSKSAELRRRLLYSGGTSLRDKYVYVFSSIGSEYGIDSKTHGWDTRINPTWCYQHMAKELPEATNPKPSQAPNPEKLEYEVYVDGEGVLWSVRVEDPKAPRHERPHPKWQWLPDKWRPSTPGEIRDADALLQKAGQVGLSALPLPLVTPEGQPKRYYFFLSPFQLGPRALQAAMSEVGTDGLSLMYDEKTAKDEGKLVGYKREDFSGAPPLATVSLVDPYETGQRLSEMLAKALVLQLELRSKIDERVVRFDEAANEGSVNDLYYMALVLEGMKGQDTKIRKTLDEPLLDQVLEYGWTHQHGITACERLARFLGNWMLSAAHRILDIGAVKDLESVDDPLAVSEKMASLSYWFAQTRLMPNTMSGSAFMADACSTTSPPNPIAHFLDYETEGKELDLESTDGQAYTRSSDIILDLVNLSLFRRSSQLTPGAAGYAKAKALATILNNLKYFECRFGTSTDLEKKIKQDVGGGAKNIMKSGIYVLDGAQRVSAKYIQLRVQMAHIEFARVQISRLKDLNAFGGRLREVYEAAGREAAEAAEALGEHRRRLLVGEKYAQGRFDGVRATARSSRDAQDLKSQESRLVRQVALEKKEFANQLEKMERADNPKAIERCSKKALGASTRGSRYEQALDEIRSSRETMERSATAAPALVKDLVERQAEVIEAETRVATSGRQLERSADELAAFERATGSPAARAASAVVEDVKNGISRAQLYVSYLGIAVELIFVSSIAHNPNVSQRERLWAYGDLGKAVADIVKDSLVAAGVERLTWKEINKELWRNEAKMTAMRSLMTVATVVGGAYYAYKGSVKFVEYREEGETAAAVASLMLAAGGLLSVIIEIGHFAGWCSAGGAASWVAGALAATALVAIWGVQESEFEWFAKHCYFSNEGERNRLPAKAPAYVRGERNRDSWGVASQRAALERLLARYSVSSTAQLQVLGISSADLSKLKLGLFGEWSADPGFHGIRQYEVEWSAYVHISPNLLPSGANLEFKLSSWQLVGALQRKQEAAKSWVGNLGLDDLDERPREMNGVSARYSSLRGLAAGIDLVFKATRVTFVQTLTLTLETSLSLADGVKVVCSHDLAGYIGILPEHREWSNRKATFANAFV